jgi:microcystin-dependent protein
MAAGQIATGAEGGSVGDITIRAKQTPSSGTIECDGSIQLIADYPDLYALIGVVFGGNGITTFGLPDLKGRVPVGLGASDSTAWTLGLEAGVSVATAPLPSHQHDMQHNHIFRILPLGVGGGTRYIFGESLNGNITTVTPAGVSSSDPNEAIQGVVNASGGGTSTGASGIGGTHTNIQPSIGLAFYIRYRLGPTDVVQTLPISWGAINAQWQLDSSTNYPADSVNNEAVEIEDRPEGIVRIRASNGAVAGNTTNLRIVGVARVPYNFTSWLTRAFAIRTKVGITGVAGGSSFSVTLKISDPVAAGSFLATTFTRTVIEAAGTITDPEFVDAVMTSADLGPDWKPGYLFRFELEFSHPQTFTQSDLNVGLLQLNWR